VDGYHTTRLYHRGFGSSLVENGISFLVSAERWITRGAVLHFIVFG
jgi:hypothetical protein